MRYANAADINYSNDDDCEAWLQYCAGFPPIDLQGLENQWRLGVYEPGTPTAHAAGIVCPAFIATKNFIQEMDL